MGFTTIVQLESEPDRTRAVEIDLRDLPEDVALAMLRALGLPLLRGMSALEVRERLGTPTKRYAFGPDRATEEFVTGDPPHHVSCACMHDGGLIFVTMHTPLPPGED